MPYSCSNERPSPINVLFPCSAQSLIHNDTLCSTFRMALWKIHAVTCIKWHKYIVRIFLTHVVSRSAMKNWIQLMSSAMVYFCVIFFFVFVVVVLFDEKRSWRRTETNNRSLLLPRTINQSAKYLVSYDIYQCRLYMCIVYISKTMKRQIYEM